MRRIGVLLLLLIGWMPSAFALTCTQVSGFSSFSCVVDDTAHTIVLTETITGAQGIISLQWAAPDLAIAYTVTKTVTNATNRSWTNLDNELYVPDGSGGYTHSNDFDGTSFNQGDPGRVLTSQQFSNLFVDELQDRDFVQFLASCSIHPLPEVCGSDGGAGDDLVANGETDVEIMEIISNSITDTQFRQTWNLGVAGGQAALTSRCFP